MNTAKIREELNALVTDATRSQTRAIALLNVAYLHNLRWTDWLRHPVYCFRLSRVRRATDKRR